MIKQVLGRNNRLHSLIKHGPNRKRPVQQLFHCCVCITCGGKDFTEPLPSNNRGINIQAHRPMGGIYAVRR
jgi:hypothetical protein